jgi:DNA-binding HxlR family transcriptional regulator
VEYSLTPLGKSLVEVLWKLNAWGELLLENSNKS